jgi:gluconokinase
VSLVDLAQAESPLVLALDVGTSSCRGSVYDGGAHRVANLASQRVYAPVTTAEGGAELDADALVGNVVELIDDLMQQGGLALERVRAVATCTFWHSLLGLDQAGRPATPVYLWMDARSRSAMAQLKGQLDERAVHARTGCVFHWSYWPAKLVWLSESQASLFRTVRRWVSFGEYLVERLTGQTGVSVSMASGTGLFNQQTCDWDAEVLAVLPVQPEQLAPIVTSGLTGGLRSPFLQRWPWLRRAVWMRAVGDGACSNLGSGCVTRQRLALMIGTSGALRALWRMDEAPGRQAAPLAVPWGAWCYRADAWRAVLGGALNDGGSLLAWLRAALRLPAATEVETELAALEPDAHGLTPLPLWAGERSPGWAGDARGAIVGLRLHTRPIEILRAALEAVAIYFARIEAVLRQAVPEAHEIIGTGAALLGSPTWLQITADVLGRPVLASAEPQASSRGAALLALEALSAMQPEEIERLPASIERVYEPVAAHTQRYRAAAERQMRLYEILIGQSGRRGDGVTDAG